MNYTPEKNKRKTFSAVLMENISSSEYFLKIGSEPKQVLQSINLDIKKGELWAIVGKNKYELTLLLEIMANIKPYQSGKCILLERGMLRHKRVILPNVFYIGNTSMIYNNMNVLEFLMFASANNNFDIVTQQERIFEQLISFGLGNVSLSPISTLTNEYKSLILLIVAAYSNNQLIIINLPDLSYNLQQKASYIKISEYLRSHERTLVASSIDFDIIENLFDHVSILHKGNILFKGEAESLRLSQDDSILTIVDDDVNAIKSMLQQKFLHFNYSIDGDILTITNNLSKNNDLKQIYKEIITAGYTPEKIKINPKSIKNACEELYKQYDL